MGHRCKLRLDKCDARRFRIGTAELTHQSFEAAERIQVAQILCRLLLLLEDEFADADPLGIAPEAVPRCLQRTFQIDDGDLAVGSRRELDHQIGGHRRVRYECHAALPPGVGASLTSFSRRPLEASETHSEQRGVNQFDDGVRLTVRQIQ